MFGEKKYVKDYDAVSHPGDSGAFMAAILCILGLTFVAWTTIGQ